MATAHSPKLTKADRRRGLRLAIVSAVFGSAASVLATGSLLFGIALVTSNLDSRAEMHSILAGAAGVGLLRLAAPYLMRRMGSVKRVAVGFGLMSGVVSIAIPFWMFVRHRSGLLAPEFVDLLVVQQLFDGLSMVAVWTWISELAPEQIRGRYLGRREGWRLLAVAPLIIAVGWFANYLRDHTAAGEIVFVAFALPIALGGVLQLISAIVLLWMPDVTLPPAEGQGRRWLALLSPWTEPRFGRLLLFACWSLFFLGITLRAQESFPRHMLDIGLLPVLAMIGGMTLGQAAMSPWLGRLCDRLGNRPVIAASQLIAASGMLFYLFASPEQPWWIGVAWVAFIANAGVTLGLNNLMLKFAPPGKSAIYIANFLAFTALAYAIGVVVGGIMFEEFWYDKFLIAKQQFDNFDYLFYIGWVTRTMGVVLLIGLAEPGAISLLALLLSRWKVASELAVPAQPSRHPLD